MRSTAIALAFFGLYFAISAWGFPVLAIISLTKDLTDSHHVSGIFYALNIVVGYVVWYGWAFFAFKQRFPFFSVRKFWVLSFVHHAIHLAYFVGDFRARELEMWPFYGWVILNVALAYIFILSSNREKPKNNESQRA